MVFARLPDWQPPLIDVGRWFGKALTHNARLGERDLLEPPTDV